MAEIRYEPSTSTMHRRRPVLSDGVCRAHIVDVWTHSRYRRLGFVEQGSGMSLVVGEWLANA